MMQNQALKNRLKVLRAEHDLTQEALAEKVGVARKTINVIEAGNYAPSVTLALKISQALHVPLEDIFSLA